MVLLLKEKVDFKQKFQMFKMNTNYTKEYTFLG